MNDRLRVSLYIVNLKLKDSGEGVYRVDCRRRMNCRRRQFMPGDNH